MRNIYSLLFMLSASATFAQPNTDIYIFDVDFEKGKISNAQNFTHWKGYDNQPFFSDDAETIYFTRRFRDQSDAYYYDVSKKIVREFTSTIESEYSPTLSPDGQFVSVVRVEKDSAQRLWKFPVNMGEPTLLFENIEPVGYHSWLDNLSVALFVLGQPNELHIANVNSGTSKTIAHGIGRSLHTQNGGLYFVHKENESQWWIKRYDIESGEITRIGETLDGREDFVVTSSGKILMGDGEYIMEWKKGKWKKLIHLKNEEILDFNRMSVSKDESKLALVAVME